MTGLAEETGGAWTPATESDTLRERAGELDREVREHEAAATLKRTEAATLRAKADRLDDPSKGVPPPKPARIRARGDGLLAAAGVTVEGMPAGFSARDLAAALGIADVGRARRLLAALHDYGKVTTVGDGWRVADPDEARVRDFVQAHPEGFTLGALIEDLHLNEMDASEYVHDLLRRGTIEGAGGHYSLVPVEPHSEPRPRRRPPEKDPPAGHDAPAGRGEPVRIVDHGKRANATSRHREKLRDKRHDEMMAAREEGSRQRREKEKRVAATRRKNKKKR